MDKDQFQASAAWRYATRLQRERLAEALHRRRASTGAAPGPAGHRPAGLAPGTTPPRVR